MAFSPITLLPRAQNSWGEFGSNLGQGFSQAIGRTLDSRDIQKGLEAISYSPDDARKLSFVHPSILKEIIRQGTPQSQDYMNSLVRRIYGQQNRPENEHQEYQQEVPGIQSTPDVVNSLLKRIEQSALERILNPSKAPEMATSFLDDLKKSATSGIAESLVKGNVAPKTAQQPSRTLQQQENPRWTRETFPWHLLQNPHQIDQVNKIFTQKENYELKQKAAQEKQNIQKEKLTKEKQKEINARKENILSLYNSIKKMKQAIKDGAHSGIDVQIIKGIGGNNALAKMYGEPTALFDTLASDYVTKKAQDFKGLRSKYQFQALERAKVGVDKSINVNKKMLDFLENEIGSSYRNLLKNDENYAIEEIDNDFPNPKEYSKNDIWETLGGKRGIHNGSQWVPLKKRK